MRSEIMKSSKQWKRLHTVVILTVIAVFGIGTLGISSADARRYYVPGSKTETKKREEARERVRYNRYRAKQMLYDDLNYREAESDFRYRDQKRKLEIEKKRRELERDDVKIIKKGKGDR